MREIKFRAWDEKNKCYYKPVYFAYGEVHAEIGSFGLDCVGYTDNLVIEQYTGLKDKNGKEIFEGDTLISELKSIYKVVFDDYSCAFMLENKYGRNMLTEGRTTNLEVIGNIHEAQL